MLKISSYALQRLDESHQETALPKVIEVMAAERPQWYVGREPSKIEAEARQWIGYCHRFNIYSFDNMAKLFGLYGQWGGFNDPESHWITELLSGSFPEDIKVASLEDQLYGA